MRRQSWVPVACGGAVGTLARAGVDVFIGGSAAPTGLVDAAIVTVNLVGALLLGLLTGFTIHRDVSRAVLGFVGPGILASFTTYSAFAVVIYRHLATGDLIGAIILAFGTVAAGVVVAIVGMHFGHRLGAAHRAERRTR